jgi:excisionase family DNA binding protein
MSVIEDEVLLGYDAAAKLLGVAVRTLQRWVREGRIDYVRLPARGAWSGVRFSKSHLMLWIERRRIHPRKTA